MKVCFGLSFGLTAFPNAHGRCANEVSWISRLEATRAMGASKFQFGEYPAEESRFLLRVWWD
jgi:hypothetical protein